MLEIRPIVPFQALGFSFQASLLASADLSTVIVLFSLPKRGHSSCLFSAVVTTPGGNHACVFGDCGSGERSPGPLWSWTFPRVRVKNWRRQDFSNCFIPFCTKNFTQKNLSTPMQTPSGRERSEPGPAPAGGRGEPVGSAGGAAPPPTVRSLYIIVGTRLCSRAPKIQKYTQSLQNQSAPRCTCQRRVEGGARTLRDLRLLCPVRRTSARLLFFWSTFASLNILQVE